MSYRGFLAEIPCGRGTLTSDNEAGRQAHSDLTIAEGIVSERGVFEREPGAVRYSPSPIGPRTISANFSAPRNPSGGAAIVATYRLLGAFQYLGNIANWGVSGSPSMFNTTAAAPSGAAVFVTLTQSGTTDITSVVDSVGNVYTKLGSLSFGGGTGHTEVWVSIITTSLPSGALFTVGTTPAIGIGQVHAFAGLATVDELFTVSAAIGAVAITSPSLTPVDASEGALFFYGDQTNVSGMTMATTGMTLEAGNSTGGPGWGVRLAHGVMPFANIPANALADYFPTAAVQRLLALGADGLVYKSGGGPFDALTMALTMSDQPGSSIVTRGPTPADPNTKAFFFDNGVTKIQVLTGDGAATTTFGNNWNTTTNIPVDWTTNPPRGAVMHKERLWAFAPANQPHNIYASAIGDPEQFKNAVGGTLEYVQSLAHATGLRIAAAVSFKGFLFVFKYPRGVLFLDDTDVDFQNWRWSLVTDSVGIADSPNAVLVLDDDILFMDPNGHFHLLSAVTQGGIQSSDATSQLNLQEWTRDNIAVGLLNQTTSTWYPNKKLALFGVPRFGRTDNSLRIFLDFSNPVEGTPVRISYSYRDVNRVLATRQESDGLQKPIVADDDGLVWRMDQTSKQKVGETNTGQTRFKYVETDFRHLEPTLVNKRKIFDALTLNFDPVGAWDLNVDVFIDGKYRETLQFPMGLGELVFPLTLPFTFGGGTVTTLRRRMTGSGYWLSLAPWISGDTQDFSLSGFVVNFRVSDEDQRK